MWNHPEADWREESFSVLFIFFPLLLSCSNNTNNGQALVIFFSNHPSIYLELTTIFNAKFLSIHHDLSLTEFFVIISWVILPSSMSGLHNLGTFAFLKSLFCILSPMLVLMDYSLKIIFLQIWRTFPLLFTLSLAVESSFSMHWL
jgi:hypothetical protein